MTLVENNATKREVAKIFLKNMVVEEEDEGDCIESLVNVVRVALLDLRETLLMIPAQLGISLNSSEVYIDDLLALFVLRNVTSCFCIALVSRDACRVQGTRLPMYLGKEQCSIKGIGALQGVKQIFKERASRNLI
jgi:hypothetical protein